MRRLRTLPRGGRRVARFDSSSVFARRGSPCESTLACGQHRARRLCHSTAQLAVAFSLSLSLSRQFLFLPFGGAAATPSQSNKRAAATATVLAPAVAARQLNRRPGRRRRRAQTNFRPTVSAAPPASLSLSRRTRRAALRVLRARRQIKLIIISLALSLARGRSSSEQTCCRAATSPGQTVGRIVGVVLLAASQRLPQKTWPRNWRRRTHCPFNLAAADWRRRPSPLGAALDSRESRADLIRANR